MTATSVRTARMTPSKVRKLRSLWARRASIASLKVSERATRLLRHPTLGAMPERRPVDADLPELPELSNAVTPKADLRGSADTSQYEYRSPFVSRKCGGYLSLDAAERICFASVRGPMKDESSDSAPSRCVPFTTSNPPF